MPMTYPSALWTQAVPDEMEHEIKWCYSTSQDLNIPGGVSRPEYVFRDSGIGLLASSADDVECLMSRFKVL